MRKLRVRKIITVGAILVASITLALVPAVGHTAPPSKTEAEIKQEIVRRVIVVYAGSCPCPYNTDRAGRSCGRRSAYSRPGGASPICYSQDVTKKMVDGYRKANRQ